MVSAHSSSRSYGGILLAAVSLVISSSRLCQRIWTLPKLTLAFSTNGISTLQNVLVDSHDPPALSLPQEVPQKPQELDVEQLLIAPIT